MAVLAVSDRRTVLARPLGTASVQWIKSFGDRLTQVLAMAPDRNGNVVIAGTFAGPVDFGGCSVSGTGTDAFVANFAPDGRCAWAFSAGGTGHDEASNIATDAAGNVYVAGTFNGTISIGGQRLTSVGASDIFVAKYRADGTPSWSTRFGGPDSDHSVGIGIEPTGRDVIVAASFVGTIHAGQETLSSAGQHDVLLARLDANGSVTWAKRFGGTGVELVGAVSRGAGGEVVVAGEFDGTTNLGGAPLAAVADRDVFVAHYGPSGDHIWSKRFGDEGLNSVRSVAIDSNGGIVLAGSFAKTIDFGPGLMTSTGTTDGYVARFSNAGAAIWSKHFGGVPTRRLRSQPAWFPTESVVNSVVTTPKGDVVCAGAFGGRGEIEGTPLTAEGPFGDMLVVTYSRRGQPGWLARVGGGGAHWARAVARHPSGDLLFAGEFDGRLALPNHPLDGVGAFLTRVTLR